MPFYYRADRTFQNVQGQALAGGQLYVCTQPANTSTIPPTPLATLYATDSGTALANPLTADNQGNFFYYANPGFYTEVYVYQGAVVKVLIDQNLAEGSASNVVFSTNGVPNTDQAALNLYCSNGTITLSSDSSGNVDLIAVGGTGTVNSGTAGQLTYYAATGTAVSGNANATISAGALTLGVSGTAAGSVILSSSTSGTVTLATYATTTSYTFKLPSSAGTANYVLQTDGSGNTSWVAQSGGSSTTVNVQTASYTAQLSDNTNVVVMNVSSANTFTVPPNASVAFPVGATLTIIQEGTGQVTLTPGSGVTFYNPSSLTTRTQYSTVSLTQIATNVWIAAGDLT